MTTPSNVHDIKEAMLYEKRPEHRVRCDLCAHRCVIADGEKGLCQVRENRGGTLYTLVYGRTIAQHVDPIEKKPLFHFFPGTTAFSMATPGCNFRCQWCQNWEISQGPRPQDVAVGQKANPDQIVARAKQSGCRSIAYTYTEPTIFFEYAYDTARIAREAGLANLYVSNGYMTEEMLERFSPYLDAINVDLKAFKDETYRKYVGARLNPVLQSLKTIKRLGIWLEVTTLVIPGINDDPSEIKDAVAFVAEELGPDTPWHISRFFPSYRLTHVPPTPIEKLKEAKALGQEAGLHHVYIGNTGNEENTLCSRCGAVLIRRSGYRIKQGQIRADGHCAKCGAALAGIGMGANESSRS